jgi:hypothetical protein
VLVSSLAKVLQQHAVLRVVLLAALQFPSRTQLGDAVAVYGSDVLPTAVLAVRISDDVAISDRLVAAAAHYLSLSGSSFSVLAISRTSEKVRPMSLQ